LVVVAVDHHQSERCDEEVDLEHTHLIVQDFSNLLIHNGHTHSRNHRVDIVSETPERLQKSS